MQRNMQTLSDPFNSDSPTLEGEGVGGAVPARQAQHENAVADKGLPQLQARIYHSSGLKMYEPIEGQKRDQVENIYLPPNRAAESAGDKSQAGALNVGPGSRGFGDKLTNWFKYGGWK
jgi:hypothetical protein